MIVYGRNVAFEYLKNYKKDIRKIIIQDGFNDKKLLSALENTKFDVIYKDKRYMDDLSKGVHQGIILDVMDYQYTPLNDLLNSDAQFVVILDHLEDPHNFGAIIRTSEAALVDAIIIPQDREVQVNSTVMKTSAGALAKMNICRVTNLVQTINKLKDDGFWIVGTAMDGTDYRQIDYSGKIALVVGNEGNGMSRLVRESCDFVASIPMRGEINSLNASVATGIMIYEVVRNRK
ncbi:MAG: 23S rRNA (guanosine(2251)-2'-O)-methyltransferase RlmB [Clostridium sp.]|jgi:RNA methyltransferase, trmH family, group 3|nr:23S rRNA (guanosine(2251)-2'-O)-methyltransferase RlmB [Clostridium sp.]MEE0092981.1 23S rRNA (guanosine(2251)-2'-O)-methyltransferase RlmB [Bacilli bacterium]